MAQLDEKVKKSSSQSLIKMQAAQMMSTSTLKDFHGQERRQTFKSSANSAAVSKRATFDPQAAAAAKIESSGSTKKLIFAFKKNEK